ncbi:GvpL/GvpF family gas vesicle protein [Kribbella pittospori]|uniref:GvpL/GvpF family gas vesicle protein n=1 Tax=Kribbella pittospori TaxID=722689 RepID=UPI0013F3BD80|nr:GvpL/GvpF family gas vesicle protein [Kribbella pittospori]
MVDAEVGCYLYGIVAADLRLPDGLTGLDDQPVELVRLDDVAAVTSGLNADRQLARRDDLLAHSRVLDAVAAVGAVIPVRFGSLLHDRSELLKQVLEPDSLRFADMLRELTGLSQYTVRIRYDEVRVLPEIVAENPEIARLRQQTRDRPEESSYQARVRLGELVANALEAKRGDDAQMVLARIEPFSVALSVGEPGGPEQLIDVALLVENRRRDRFEKAAEELAAELADRAVVKLVGPTAAYDFVGAERTDGWA